MQLKSGPSLTGVATVVKMNLLIATGLAVVIAGTVTAGAPVLSVSAIAAVFGVAAVGLYLVAVNH